MQQHMGPESNRKVQRKEELWRELDFPGEKSKQIKQILMAICQILLLLFLGPEAPAVSDVAM